MNLLFTMYRPLDYYFSIAVWCLCIEQAYSCIAAWMFCTIKCPLS